MAVSAIGWGNLRYVNEGYIGGWTTTTSNGSNGDWTWLTLPEPKMKVISGPTWNDHVKTVPETKIGTMPEPVIDSFEQMVRDFDKMVKF